MSKSKNKRKKSKLGFIVLLAIFAYFAYIAVGQQEILHLRAQELQKIEDKIDEEAKLNEELKKEQDQLSSDEFIEKAAREKLGMIKKGERVYVDIGK